MYPMILYHCVTNHSVRWSRPVVYWGHVEVTVVERWRGWGRVVILFLELYGGLHGGRGHPVEVVLTSVSRSEVMF